MVRRIHGRPSWLFAQSRRPPVPSCSWKLQLTLAPASVQVMGPRLLWKLPESDAAFAGALAAGAGALGVDALGTGVLGADADALAPCGTRSQRPRLSVEKPSPQVPASTPVAPRWNVARPCPPPLQLQASSGPLAAQNSVPPGYWHCTKTPPCEHCTLPREEL